MLIHSFLAKEPNPIRSEDNFYLKDAILEDIEKFRTFNSQKFDFSKYLTEINHLAKQSKN